MDASRDMVIKKGGQMIMLIRGEMLIMETDVIAPDGTWIRTDGAIFIPDGATGMLMEDEALVIDLALTRQMER